MTSDRDQIVLRLPSALVEAIDARAAKTSHSRNAWIQRALSYVLTELPAGATADQRAAARAKYESGDI